MYNIKIFENAEFGQVRTVILDGEPWFVGKDVAEALGYKDTDQALRKHVDNEDKLTSQFDGSGQKREFNDFWKQIGIRKEVQALGDGRSTSGNSQDRYLCIADSSHRASGGCSKTHQCNIQIDGEAGFSALQGNRERTVNL